MKLSKLLFLFFSFLFFQITNAVKLKDLMEQYKEQHDITFCFEDFERDIYKFININKNKMWESSKWLKEKTPSVNWFDNFKELEVVNLNTGVSNKFLPYTEKLIIEPEDKVVFFGDLHGDLDFFIELIGMAGDLGLLDEDYNISSPQYKNTYFIFLGDYVARGEKSLEILYLLAKFYNQNPGKVFLLRGNHEVFGLADLTERSELKEQGAFYRLLLTHCWFDFFPLAIYLGCKDFNGVTNFIQCCHAGIEVGYNPKEFLNDDNVQFEVIFNLNRKKALCDENIVELVTNNGIFSLKENPEFKLYKYLVENLKPKDIQKMGFNGLGFLWSDFLFDTYENENGEKKEYQGIYFDPVRGAFTFSRDVTEYFFRKYSSENNVLRGCIRGHQHGESMGFELAHNGGCLKLWGGLVYTLISSFWSVSGKRLDLKSFMVLETTPNIFDWKIDHYFAYKTNNEMQISINSFNYFD